MTAGSPALHTSELAWAAGPGTRASAEPRLQPRQQLPGWAGRQTRPQMGLPGDLGPAELWSKAPCWLLLPQARPH